MALSYVHACATDRWHIEMWRRDGSDPTRRHFTFRCNSWRHAGCCRRYCGACDFARVSEALAQHQHWSLLVLTYPQREWPRNKMDELFRFGLTAWSRLRKRLIEEVGRIGYIQTWEIHKSEYPHCNVAITNAHLLRYAKCDPREKNGWKQAWLEKATVEVGFGKVCCLKPIHDQVGMAGYLTKVAMELTGAGAKGQVPVNAPRHFRRLRASRGMLPPRIRSADMTGRLVKTPLPAEVDAAPPPRTTHDNDAGFEE